MPGFFAVLALFIKELMLIVSYVKNNAFPQPLSEKDEALHLQLMAEGNADSRNKLIEHNLRLVAHIVKKVVTKSNVKIILFSTQLGWRRREDFRLIAWWKCFKKMSRLLESVIFNGEGMPEFIKPLSLVIDNTANHYRLIVTDFLFTTTINCKR